MNSGIESQLLFFKELSNNSIDGFFEAILAFHSVLIFACQYNSVANENIHFHQISFLQISSFSACCKDLPFFNSGSHFKTSLQGQARQLRISWKVFKTLRWLWSSNYCTLTFGSKIDNITGKFLVNTNPLDKKLTILQENSLWTYWKCFALLLQIKNNQCRHTCNLQKLR